MTLLVIRVHHYAATLIIVPKCLHLSYQSGHSLILVYTQGIEFNGQTQIRKRKIWVLVSFYTCYFIYILLYYILSQAVVTVDVSDFKNILQRVTTHNYWVHMKLFKKNSWLSKKCQVIQWCCERGNCRHHPKQTDTSLLWMRKSETQRGEWFVQGHTAQQRWS